MSEATLTADANPYSAPDAALDTGQDDLYQPKIFSFNGRIGPTIVHKSPVTGCKLNSKLPFFLATVFGNKLPGWIVHQISWTSIWLFI